MVSAIYKKRIGIIYGGDARNHLSMHNAFNLHSAFRNKDNVSMIEINKDEILENKIKSSPHKAFSSIDIAIDLTHHYKHKPYHHDLLEKMGVKIIFREEIDNYNIRKLLDQFNISFPIHYSINVNDDLKYHLHNLWRTVHLPVIIKPEHKILPSLETYSAKELIEHVKTLIFHEQNVLIDESHKGIIYTTFAIKNLRGQDIYLTPIVEIKNKEINKIVHSLSDSQRKEATRNIKRVSAALDEHILRFDFTFKKDEFVLLHITTKSNFSEGKLMYEVFKDNSITYDEIVDGVEID